MRCGCGYNGPADIVHPSTNKAKSYFKCPQCKSSEDMLYITGIDNIKLAIQRPMEKKERVQAEKNSSFEIVRFNTGRLIDEEGMIGYRIEAPIDYGSHTYGWITIKEYMHIKEYANKVGEDYSMAFEEIDCYICKNIKPNFKCKHIIKRWIDKCEGKTLEDVEYEKRNNTKP